MLKANYIKYNLNFKLPAGTSRGIIDVKETFFIKIIDPNGKIGIGECALFRGLSYDDKDDYEDKLQWLCDNINLGKEKLLQLYKSYPSIQFGLETAFLDLISNKQMEIFKSEFTEGIGSIPINGLIWMGNQQFMTMQIHEKLNDNFSCLKLKIGAINFNDEISIIKNIRKNFSKNDLEIRVDANGAFSTNEALEKLKILSDLDIHSIEQPIKHGNIDEMTKLCEISPVDIALDEELIGVINTKDKENIIERIKPKYIILKPSLVGGFKASKEWIDIAEKNNCSWWVTSALESNIGLSAIAQWTYTLNNPLPQGLGTGLLFSNNFESPLAVKDARLYYHKNKSWDISQITKKLFI